MNNTTTTPDTGTATIPAGELRPILAGLGKLSSKTEPPGAPGHLKVSTAKSGTAELCAGDGDRWASVRLPGATEGTPTEFLAPIAGLRVLLKGVRPGEAVSLSAGRDTCLIGTGKKLTRLAAPPVGKYPTTPQFKGKAHTLKSGVTRAITEAARNASTDATRYVLNGVHLDTSSDKGHHIVGTDGRQLYSANSFKLPVKSSLTLGAHPFLSWRPFVEASDQWGFRLAQPHTPASIGSYELTSGAWRIVGRLVEGNYPAWRQVVPKRSEFKAFACFDYDGLPDLARELSRMPVAAAGSDKSRAVALQGDGKHLTLSWRDAESGKTREIRPPKAKPGKRDFYVLLDRDRLARALSMGFEEMRVIDDISPVQFVGEGGRQLILMPLRPGANNAPDPPRARKPRPESRPKPERPAPPPTTTPPTRKPTMPKDKPPSTPDDMPALDAALHELAKVRDTLRHAAGGLQAAAAQIKRAKAEGRSADKEIRQARSTLESLRKIRL